MEGNNVDIMWILVLIRIRVYFGLDKSVKSSMVIILILEVKYFLNDSIVASLTIEEPKGSRGRQSIYCLFIGQQLGEESVFAWITF